MDKLKTAMAVEIERYLHQRAEKKGGDNLEKFAPNVWLADAARRAEKLRLVTHSVKFTHSAAKGSSINITRSRLKNLAPDGVVMSSNLNNSSENIDAVCNAGVLDVANLLRLHDGNETLFDQLIRGDRSALTYFAATEEQGAEWAEGFLKVLQQDAPSSDTLAKQLYMPVREGEYHLLSPLHSSIISNKIFKKITDTYSLDEAKEARNARGEGKSSQHMIVVYPNIAKIKFGGAKPQNISLLNSARLGVGHLLNCAPPNWRNRIQLPIKVESIFSRYFIGYFVRDSVNELREFLKTHACPEVNNVTIRDTRAEFVDDIAERAIAFAAMLQKVTDRKGWSTLQNCKLNRVEQLWLDVGRAATDEEFRSERERGNWQAEVAGNFARWLNQSLEFKGATLGDPEFSEWRKVFLDKLNEIEESSKEVV